MSAQPITAISSSTKASSSGSSSSAVQSDPQVQQLKYQINDWSTCPTTPPAMKKTIVAKLQSQLDSVENSLENHAKNVHAQKQAGSPQPSKFRSPFKVDTYA